MEPSAVGNTIKKLLIVILLIIVLTVFQANNAILSTILSGKFFTSVYDKYDPTGYLLERIVTVPTPVGSTAGSQVPYAGGTGAFDDVFYYTNLYLDRNWFTREAPALLKGFHSYFTGSSSRLPALDIKPVKSMLTDVVIYEFLVSGPREEAAFKIALIFKAFDSLVKSNNIKYGTPITDSTLDSVISSEEFKALGLSIDKSTLNSVLSTYVFMRESGSKNDDIMKAVVSRTLDGLTGLDSVSDELDLNRFTASLFNKEEDPAANTRNLIISYKVISTAIFIIITVFLIFALLIFYLPRKVPAKGSSKGAAPAAPYPPFLKTAGVALALPGLIAFITGIQSKMIPFYYALFNAIRPAALSGTGQDAAGKAVGASLEVVRGLYASVLIQGAILFTAGMILIIAGIAAKYGAARTRVLLLLRRSALPAAVTAVSLVLLLTGVMAYRIVRAVNSIDKAITANTAADYAKALAESLDAEKMYAYFADDDSGFMDFFSGIEEDDEDDAAPAYIPPANVPFVEDDAAVSLRQFYRYLSSLDNYGRAMEMLDNDFTMTMSFLKRFGVDSLDKEDISEDSASEYMDILSNSSITAITWVETSGSISRIFYNQLILLEEGVQANSKLAADLELRNGRWIITRIIDQSKIK